MKNGLVLAVYASESNAHVHARTVTGAKVQAWDVLERLAPAVSDDIASDDWDEQPTPVREPPADVVETRPITPRAKAKSRPPED